MLTLTTHERKRELSRFITRKFQNHRAITAACFESHPTKYIRLRGLLPHPVQCTAPRGVNQLEKTRHFHCSVLIQTEKYAPSTIQNAAERISLRRRRRCRRRCTPAAQATTDFPSGTFRQREIKPGWSDPFGVRTFSTLPPLLGDSGSRDGGRRVVSVVEAIGPTTVAVRARFGDSAAVCLDVPRAVVHHHRVHGCGELAQLSSLPGRRGRRRVLVTRGSSSSSCAGGGIDRFPILPVDNRCCPAEIAWHRERGQETTT